MQWLISFDLFLVGFPVVNRYVWGMYGSQFVIWNRILLSLGECTPASFVSCQGTNPSLI